LGFLVVSYGLSELIEGDYFADSEANKTIMTYILDVFKCPDGYMSSQIYKERLVHPNSHLMCYRFHNHYKFLLAYADLNVLLLKKDFK
jgi:hypothetical protein